VDILAQLPPNIVTFHDQCPPLRAVAMAWRPQLGRAALPLALLLCQLREAIGAWNEPITLRRNHIFYHQQT
jgi:hypothetical protein